MNTGKENYIPIDSDHLKRIKKAQQAQDLRKIKLLAVLAVIIIFAAYLGRVDLFPDSPVDSPTMQSDRAFTDPDTAQNNGQGEILSREFREKLHIYETETKPGIRALNLPGWAPEKHTELENNERDAVQDFGLGKFVSAISKLENIFARADELHKVHAENFHAALKDAHREFESNNSQKAFAAIRRTLIYKPDDSAALRLKDRISVMEQVADLVRIADVARVENKPDEEATALAKAMSLDSAHTDLAERHLRLTEKMKERDYDEFVWQGWHAIKRGNVKQARDNLARAAKIYPDREGAKLLANQIKQMEMQSAYENIIRKARASRDDDDWSGAEEYYAGARQIFPNTEEPESGLRLARLINQYIAKIEKILLRPDRLTDVKIADAARKTIEELGEAARHSPRLQSLIARLNDAIRQASVPVPVVVYSDNKTFVSVVGVGIIGKVKEYRLKDGLKPGNYTFRGEREGFRDKHVQIRVRHGEVVRVTVICDESI